MDYTAVFFFKFYYFVIEVALQNSEIESDEYLHQKDYL